MITVKDWLSNVFYDPNSSQIFNKDENDKIQLVVDIRGFGRLQNIFHNEDDAAIFQDKIGLFIAASIREKISKECQNEK